MFQFPKVLEFEQFFKSASFINQVKFVVPLLSTFEGDVLRVIIGVEAIVAVFC